MNEEELKKIWQIADYAEAPTIDFVALQILIGDKQAKLRRKIKIDATIQSVSLVAVLIFLWFYPKLFFLFWAALAIAAWYVWEISQFYRLEKQSENGGSVRQLLNEKLRTLKNFVRRVRLVMYCLPLVLVPATCYALGFYESGAIFQNKTNSIIFTLVVAEIAAVVLTEIYFKIFYSAAINALNDLLRQLDSD